MENFVTLFCVPDDAVLLREITRLANLGGVSLNVITCSPQPPSPRLSTSLRSKTDNHSGVAAPTLVSPPPSTCSGEAGTSDSLVLTSPLARPSAPPQSVVIGLAGSGQDADLVLPQDGEQVLNLFASRRRVAKILGVRGLVAGVNTTVVAALLAQTWFYRAGDSDSLPLKQWGKTRNCATSVCLVDLTGSVLPLGDYLAPVEGENWDWRDLLHPGLPAPSRLAQGLPRWGEVSFLSGSGFIPTRNFSHVQAVLNALAQAFDIVVVDCGTGIVPLDFIPDVTLWVGNSTRQTALAWGDLPPTILSAANRTLSYLIQEHTGPLSPRQVNRVLSQIHEEIPVFGLKNQRKNQKQWDSETISWPPHRRIANELETIVQVLWQDLYGQPEIYAVS